MAAIATSADETERREAPSSFLSELPSVPSLALAFRGSQLNRPWMSPLDLSFWKVSQSDLMSSVLLMMKAPLTSLSLGRDALQGLVSRRSPRWMRARQNLLGKVTLEGDGAIDRRELREGLDILQRLVVSDRDIAGLLERWEADVVENIVVDEGNHAS